MPRQFVSGSLCALALTLVPNWCAYAQQSQSAPAATPNDDADEAVSSADNIVKATNEFRAANRLQAVTQNDSLNKAAQAFAEYMARTGAFDHHADGRTPSGRATQQGYNYSFISENIAWRSAGYPTTEIGADFVDDWKGSPGHCANMLTPNVTEIGVGIAHSKNGSYAVQMFGKPVIEEVVFHIANRTGADLKYTVGKDEFTLKARYSRVHELFEPGEIVFHPLPVPEGKDAGVSQSLALKAGSHFIVERDAKGSLKVRDRGMTTTAAQ